MTSDQLPPGGVIIPIVTPLNSDGSTDTVALRRQVQRCIKAGVGAIFAGGSAGAGPLLRDDQWEEMLQIVAEETAGKTRAMAGIIATSTARAIDQIKISQRLGYGTIVVTPTFYIALQREAEILAHFEACRQATDQELVIYNIPSCTGCQIPILAMRTMIEGGWATAIKESSGDADYFRQLLPLAAETGAHLLQGNETDIVWSIESGAAGIVPVCANYDPAMFVEIFNQVKAGTAPADAQEKINAMRDALLVGDHNWVAGITWGLHSLGMGSGVPPLPLQTIDAPRQARIENLKQKTVTT